MEEIKTPEGGTVIKIPIEDEVKQAYIDYSMSVIVSRALPDVRDGLKPVHRRIIYSMDKLNLHAGGKTRKCATIVGDVLGHYHPHGDASVYDALVRLG
ncbi:MAG TPA: DNA gyrase subunit A, partial [Treponema sp.]|nr:DNA gyrase subunit A [Treponema sp.]